MDPNGDPMSRVDRYIKDLHDVGVLDELDDIPKRSDYASVGDWMRALEAFRDRLLQPQEGKDRADDAHGRGDDPG